MSNNPNLNNQLAAAATNKSEVVLLPPVQYLVIPLAGHKYGVRLDTLQEVVRYNQLSVAPVPDMPEWLDGITNLRGSILSVVSLRAFLGLSRDLEKAATGGGITYQLPGFAHSTPRLLVVAYNDISSGIVVDDIEGVIFVQPEQIKPLEALPVYKADPALAYLSGFYRDVESQREIALLDLRRLITSPQMLQFEPANIL